MLILINAVIVVQGLRNWLETLKSLNRGQQIIEKPNHLESFGCWKEIYNSVGCVAFIRSKAKHKNWNCSAYVGYFTQRGCLKLRSRAADAVKNVNVDLMLAAIKKNTIFVGFRDCKLLKRDAKSFEEIEKVIKLCTNLFVAGRYATKAIWQGLPTAWLESGWIKCKKRTSEASKNFDCKLDDKASNDQRRFDMLGLVAEPCKIKAYRLWQQRTFCT